MHEKGGIDASSSFLFYRATRLACQRGHRPGWQLQEYECCYVRYAAQGIRNLADYGYPARRPAIGRMCAEQFDHFAVTLDAGMPSRCCANIVTLFDLDALSRKQRLYGADVPGARSKMKRCLTPEVLMIDIKARGLEKIV